MICSRTGYQSVAVRGFRTQTGKPTCYFNSLSASKLPFFCGRKRNLESSHSPSARLKIPFGRALTPTGQATVASQDPAVGPRTPELASKGPTQQSSCPRTAA